MRDDRSSSRARSRRGPTGPRRLAGWLAALGVLGLLAAAWAAPGGEQRSGTVALEVYPVLKRSCFECHGAEKQLGRLRLDLREAALRGGAAGPAVVPGKPEASELIRRISLPRDHPGRMPARGEPLAGPEVALLREWVRAGAPWPVRGSGAGPVEPRHWAYVKPVRAPLPKVKNAGWVRNGIDRFVLARLEREGLKPSPEAVRYTLVRRLSLDLTGLPPTPEEVDRFVSDPAPDAYERLVDRLLASPHFGEKWARHWLDLARYADSHGFQRDDLRELWPYRDWVIRALNADMPFDRFTIEQLAGDLLPNATEAQKVATGFHRSAPTNVEAGSEPEETRVNQVIDRVNTTASVWLGTTLECAQCHDHKYDPFTQKEYYRLFAFFNNTAIEADRANPKVPGSIRFLGPALTLADPSREPERARLREVVRDAGQALEARRELLREGLKPWAAEMGAALGAADERTHSLRPARFDSAAGSPHRVLEDGSVLLADEPPDRDTYTITVRTELTGITGFRLEALADPSLPGGGPGRGDPSRPNFVLHTFSVTASPAGGAGPAVPVRLKNARASFSQQRYDVSGAIDADPKSAWAINPRFGESHWATFETEKPVGFPQGTILTFTLVQEFGGGRTIGRPRLAALTGDPRGRSLPPEVAAILRTEAPGRKPAQWDRLLQFRVDEDSETQRLKEQRARAERELQALKPPTTLVMQELPNPRTTTVSARGDYRQPGEPVQPGTPAVLPPLPAGPPNRLTLARWLVSPENPLTARVAVNRWWAELFGRGLVSTLEDFGIKGEPPTHPELLDWLAVSFAAPEPPSKNGSGRGTRGAGLGTPDSALGTGPTLGWSMKRLLRLIVTSATYRQSSRVTPALLARDDQNRLLARGPRFRLDAETIRDNALTAAGLLSRKQFGPPVRPYQPEGIWTKIGGDRVEYVVSPGEDRYRRGVYVVWKRASPYPSFVSFDATARLACTPKRSRTNTPLQALTLLNDPVYVEAAMALARRVLEHRAAGELEGRIRYAFRLCVVRPPREAEVRTLRRLYEMQLGSLRAEGKAARELTAGFAVPAGASPEELAAWHTVATVLLNLDETITKN